MPESQENTVVSLCEFRKRHPVPSGKLIRDPYSKSRIVQDSQKVPVRRSDPNKAMKNKKLQAAMEKYGSSTGNVMKTQHKNKVKLGEDESV